MTRRRVPLTVSALLAPLMVLATAVLGVAPARAASVCDPTGKLCVTSIAYSPASVSNAAATGVTITVQATSGFKNLAILMDTDLVGATGATGYTLNPVSGSSGTYRGSFTVIRNGATGSFGPTFLTATPNFGIGSSPAIGGDQLTAGGFARLAVTGEVDTAAPELVGLTAGTGTYDASRGGSIPVTARIRDAGSGAVLVQIYATAIGSDDQAGTEGGYTGTQVQLTRTAGTAQDGTWTGSLPLVGGTSQAFRYFVNLADAKGNSVLLEDGQLAARGLPATFRTVTTGVVPAAPSGLTLTSTFDVASIRWVVVATWNKPANGAVSASSWLVTSSGSCVQPNAQQARDNRFILSKSSGSGICRVSVKARNAVGTSAASGTATALLP